MQFFVACVQTLFHSIWQAALLSFVYFLLNKFFKSVHPLQKRNLLYLLLFGQIFVSLVSFIIIINHYEIGFPLFQIKSQQWFDKYAAIIGYIYFAIVCLKLGYTFYQWKVFKLNYKQQLIKPAVEIKIFTALKAKQLQIKKAVLIFYSKNVNIPITFGFVKPVILLPCSLATSLTMAELEAIILHELIHIKCNDFILNWITIVVENIFFFNPFVKIIIANIKIEREKNCDASVLQFQYNSLLYANVLLKIASYSKGLKLFEIGITNKRNQLLKRILFFSSLEHTSFSNKKILIPITISLFVMLSMFSINTLSPQKRYAENNVTKKQILLLSKNIKPTYKKEIPVIIEASLSKISSQSNKQFQKEIDKPNHIKAAPADDYLLDKNLLTSVNFNEVTDSVKTFLYNIETQKGKMWQNYKLTKHNDRWHLQPQWMIVESYDTILNKIDTLVNMVDSIQ